MVFQSEAKAKLPILAVEDSEAHSPFSGFSLSTKKGNFPGLLEAILERRCLDSYMYLARVKADFLGGTSDKCV